MVEIMIIRLWFNRDDMNPDPMRAQKYPMEIIRNRVPASAWERFSSFSIRGARGADAMRDMKLTKKINVSRRSGPN